MANVHRAARTLVSTVSVFALLGVGVMPAASVMAVQEQVGENVDFSTPVDLGLPLTPADPCVEPNTLPYPCPGDPGNLAPVADSQWVAMVQDGQLPIVLTGSDPDGDALTYEIVYGPEHGKWEPVPFPGPTGFGIIYTPEPGYVGSDYIKFRVSDGQLSSDSGVAYIEVKPKPAANHAPVAYPGDYVTTVDQPIAVMLSATDEDGDELAYTVYDPTNGEVGPSALPAIGAYTYTPDAGFIGTDYIYFLVNDGEVDSNIAKVTVVVKDEPTEPPAVAEVSATPPAGTYVGGQSVALAAEGADSIRYTTDGSTPNCSVAMPESIVEPNGTLYEGAISVPSSLTIRAIACYPMGYHSEVGVFPYTINTPPSGGGGGGGGAPLPLPGFNSGIIGGTVLGTTTVAFPVTTPRVLGASTCLSQLNKPLGVIRPDAKLAKRLAGRILLKVESCGEAWYVNPQTLVRHQLPNNGDGVAILRKLALKVSDAQLKKVAVGDINSRKGRANVAAAYRGRVLEAADGSLWYVSPADGKRYRITSADELLKAMKLLGMGISNANIAKIPVAD